MNRTTRSWFRPGLTARRKIANYSSPRIWYVRGRWGDDQAEIADAVKRNCISSTLSHGGHRFYSPKHRLDVVLGLVFPRQFIERRLVTSFPVTTFRHVKLLVFVIFN